MITLATLSQASAQEVFDQVVDHLRKQGKPSFMDEGSARCAYRGHSGLKCAAGCLISDNEYRVTMENRTWSAMVRDTVVPIHHANLIESLQEIHDSNEPKNWEYRLEFTAKRFNLQYKKPE